MTYFRAYEDFMSLFSSKFLQKARIYNKWHSATIGLIFIMIRLSCYPISHPTIVTCMEFINIFRPPIFPVLSLLPYWIIVLGWFWNMVLWGYIIQNQLALVLIWSVLAFHKQRMCQNLLNSTIRWRWVIYRIWWFMVIYIQYFGGFETR